MAIYAIWSYESDIARAVTKCRAPTDITCGDDQAHQLQVTVRNQGTVVDLSQATVNLYAVRSDGVTVLCTGAGTANGVATAMLTQACYEQPGCIQLLLRISLDGHKHTVLWLEGNARSGATDVYAQTAIIPSLDALLAKITDMETARTATLAATTAAANATETAQDAASVAQSAAQLAIDAASAVTGITAQATTLEADAPASAAAQMVDGHVHVLLGIPQGTQGVRGTVTHTGTSITGTSIVPTAYATGISDAIVGDMYRYNGTAGDSIGNIYECVLGGDADTALWIYSGNLRGVPGSGNTDSVDGILAGNDGNIVLSALRYAAQSLSDNQQAVARANISALGMTDVIDNLTALDIDKPLSARQGRALKTLIDGVTPVDITATLVSTGWTAVDGGYTQDVTITGMTATTMGDAAMAMTATDEQEAAAAEAQLKVTAQAADTITVKARGTCPTLDLPIVVRMVG